MGAAAGGVAAGGLEVCGGGAADLDQEALVRGGGEAGAGQRARRDLGQEEGEDPDFGVQHNTSQWPRMRQRLEALFANEDRQHWEAVFHDSEACVAPILDLDEAPHHPQAKARGAFLESGGITQPAPAPRLSVTPARVRSLPPQRGEHTFSLLAGAGMGPGEIEQMVRCGAVWAVDT